MNLAKQVRGRSPTARQDCRATSSGGSRPSGAKGKVRHTSRAKRVQRCFVGSGIWRIVRASEPGNSSFTDKRRERQILRNGVGAEG